MVETSFTRLKQALLELKDGYPEYVFYGKVEFFMKTGKWAVDLLDKHEIIEKIPREEVKNYIEKMTPEEHQKLLLLPEEDRFRWYRLTAKGLDLTISMINLEYSEKISDYSGKVLEYNKEVSRYSQETHYFTKVLIWFTGILVLMTFGLFIFAFLQSIIFLWF